MFARHFHDDWCMFGRKRYCHNMCRPYRFCNICDTRFCQRIILACLPAYTLPVRNTQAYSCSLFCYRTNVHVCVRACVIVWRFYSDTKNTIRHCACPNLISTKYNKLSICWHALVCKPMSNQCVVKIYQEKRSMSILSMMLYEMFMYQTCEVVEYYWLFFFCFIFIFHFTYFPSTLKIYSFSFVIHLNFFLRKTTYS